MVSQEIFSNIVTNCSDLGYHLCDIDDRQRLALGTLIEYEYQLLSLKPGTKERFSLTDAITDESIEGGFIKDGKSYFYDDFCIDDLILPERIIFPMDVEDVDFIRQRVWDVVLCVLLSKNKFSKEEAQLLGEFRHSFRKFYGQLYTIAINLNHFTARTEDKHTISDKYFDLSKLDERWKDLQKPLKISLYLPKGSTTFFDRRLLIQDADKITKFSRNSTIINRLIWI